MTAFNVVRLRVLLLLAGLMFAVPAPADPSPNTHAAASDITADGECQAWQHRDADGNCSDDPGTEHHHGHYEPHAGEQCWVECECFVGQFPADDSCAPCTEVGTVCRPE